MRGLGQGLLINVWPRCPRCGAVARPNILMFGDYGWLEWRSRLQAGRLQDWLQRCTRPVVVEVGAGTSIPSVWRFSQATIERDGVLVRINPDTPGVPRSLDVPIAGRAEATLTAIDEVLGRDCC